MPVTSSQRPEPCRDWHEWADIPDQHPDFSYWRWDDEDSQASEQRLGERLYIMACLLWSSLHDYCLARRFTDSYPNWSAICSYYSMVHALRLFWLLAYGSYPTGHKQMADRLTSSINGTRANWQRDTLG